MKEASFLLIKFCYVFIYSMIFFKNINCSQVTLLWGDLGQAIFKKNMPDIEEFCKINLHTAVTLNIK